MISTTKSKIHWNYFIALERDAETVSQYIEYCDQNFDVYSIELAHLLLAAASEVDVMAKMLCKHFQPTQKCENINEYKPILLAELSDLLTLEVSIPRYGLLFKPWDNWLNPKGTNPLWWGSYNKVKHQRDTHFDNATLKNALNALSALLILIYYFYSYELACDGTKRLSAKDTMQELTPNSTLFFLPDNYYYGHLLMK